MASKEKRLWGGADSDRRSNKCAVYEYITFVTQQAFVMIICNGQMRRRALCQQRQKCVSPNGRSRPADVTRASVCVCVIDSWACVFVTALFSALAGLSQCSSFTSPPSALILLLFCSCVCDCVPAVLLRSEQRPGVREVSRQTPG